MSILCAGAFSSSPLLSMGTIIVSFPGYLSYREMPGNENSYREMPGNENAARKRSSLAGHMYTYVCMWRVGRKGGNTYGPRGYIEIVVSMKDN